MTTVNTMKQLTRDDLFSLEKYAQMRPQFREQVIAHKQNRQVQVGAHATLYFEDRLTMQYQIQEMLRVERIFEAQGIDDELHAYNPLIPDGANLKATFMLEYPDVDERRVALEQLQGVERRVWMKVGGFDHVWAIADEDMERENEQKTSAVHFLRFEFTPQMITALKQGAPLGAGIEHEHYCEQNDPLPNAIRAALMNDFD